MKTNKCHHQLLLTSLSDLKAARKIALTLFPAVHSQPTFLCNPSKMETFINEKGKKSVGPLCFQVPGTGKELGSWELLVLLYS